MSTKSKLIFIYSLIALFVILLVALSIDISHNNLNNNAQIQTTPTISSIPNQTNSSTIPNTPEQTNISSFPQSNPNTNNSPTITSTPVQLTQGAQQSQADQNYGNAQSQVLQNYPWYNSLPLQNNNYYVYFDLQTKTMIAKLYTNDPTEDSQLKNTITTQLESLGVNLSVYPITWDIESQ